MLIVAKRSSMSLQKSTSLHFMIPIRDSDIRAAIPIRLRLDVACTKPCGATRPPLPCPPLGARHNAPHRTVARTSLAPSFTPCGCPPYRARNRSSASCRRLATKWRRTRASRVCISPLDLTRPSRGRAVGRTRRGAARPKAPP